MGKKIKVEEFTKQVRFFFDCKECGATDFIEEESLDNILAFACDNCGELHKLKNS